MACEVDINGTRSWRNKQGQLHRTDGPAIIHADGSQFWYRNDQLHRTDSPAVIGADGTRAWYRDGQLHRTDGPAVIFANGAQQWRCNGKVHRIDGPAEIEANGDQAWCIKGHYITSEVEAWMKIQDVAWPWDSSTQTLFVLTFGV